MAQRVHLGARTAERIIEELLVQTPQVVQDAYRRIPDGFPQDVADSILQGMLRQLETLRGQPPGVASDTEYRHGSIPRPIHF